MEFPILSALAELGGAYARYCGRRLMRKLGGYEAAESRRVRRRAVVEKRAVADKRAAAAISGVPALGDIREIISGRWDVRHNALSNNLEAKPAGLGNEAFEPLTERMHNSMVNRVQEVFPLCLRSKIDSYLFSDEVPSFNPLRAYLLGLPAWDGTDRIGELAARVSDDALWTRVFRTWLRGAVKGWLQEEDGGAAPRVFDCQTAPLLVSERQGLGKSTFCRMLLPECLRIYYSDKFDLSSDSHSEKLLGQFALINMDEFDRYSERQMGVLKNLMQLTDVKMRRPRSRGLSEVRRLAAFIGTSNYSELLADPTGSRRFFCQIVERPIGNALIDHEQLYAQAVAEIGAGKPTFFSKEEEAEIEAHNRTFYRESPLADAFGKSFAAAGERQEWLSANEIFEILKQESPKALQGVTIARLGKQLRLRGVAKRHTAQGNLYGVCRRE
ncbi:MAG: VapE family protein [Bacteroidales bacterium]|nr:VapE family protein [Bacteroidales bacterium]